MVRLPRLFAFWFVLAPATGLTLACGKTDPSAAFSSEAASPTAQNFYASLAAAANRPGYLQNVAALKKLSLSQFTQLAATGLTDAPVSVGASKFVGLKTTFNQDRVGQQLLASASAGAGTIGSLLSAGHVHDHVSLEDVQALVGHAESILRQETGSDEADETEFALTAKAKPKKKDTVKDVKATAKTWDELLQEIATDLKLLAAMRTAAPAKAADQSANAASAAGDAVTVSLGSVVGTVWTDTFSKATFPVCPDSFLQDSKHPQWGYVEATKTSCYVKNPKLPG